MTYVDDLCGTRDVLQRAIREAFERDLSPETVIELKGGLRAIQDAIGEEMGATAASVDSAPPDRDAVIAAIESAWGAGYIADALIERGLITGARSVVADEATVERVARAMYHTEYSKRFKDVPDWDAYWNNHLGDPRKSYRELARAALGALTEGKSDA